MGSIRPGTFKYRNKAYPNQGIIFLNFVLTLLK